jgi:hypothetical protein
MKVGLAFMSVLALGVALVAETAGGNDDGEPETAIASRAGQARTGSRSLDRLLTDRSVVVIEVDREPLSDRRGKCEFRRPSGR